MHIRRVYALFIQEHPQGSTLDFSLPSSVPPSNPLRAQPHKSATRRVLHPAAASPRPKAGERRANRGFTPGRRSPRTARSGPAPHTGTPPGACDLLRRPRALSAPGQPGGALPPPSGGRRLPLRNGRQGPGHRGAATYRPAPLLPPRARGRRRGLT